MPKGARHYGAASPAAAALLEQPGTRTGFRSVKMPPGSEGFQQSRRLVFGKLTLSTVFYAEQLFFLRNSCLFRAFSSDTVPGTRRLPGSAVPWGTILGGLSDLGGASQGGMAAALLRNVSSRILPLRTSHGHRRDQLGAARRKTGPKASPMRARGRKARETVPPLPESGATANLAPSNC